MRSTALMKNSHPIYRGKLTSTIEKNPLGYLCLYDTFAKGI